MVSRRLLIVTTDAATLEAFLLPYAAHFRNLGWQVEAAASNTVENHRLVHEFDRVHEIRWQRSPLSVSNVRAFLDIRGVMTSGHFDVVHLHTPVAAAIARMAIAFSMPSKRPRVVYTAHGFHFYDGQRGLSSAVFKLAERIASRWTDEMIVLNREDFRTARRLHLVSEDHLHLVPGVGIDVMAWSGGPANGTQPQSLRRSLSIAVDAVVMITVAELNPGKRHRDLLQALSDRRLAAVHAVFAGSGPEEVTLRQQVETMGLDGRVHFLGFRDDVADLIRMADVMVLPSEREGLPRSVLEAMCIGVPVVAADARGSRDLLAGGAGLLYPPGDAAALSESIVSVITDDTLSRDLVSTACDRVGTYDIYAILRQHERIFDQLL